MNFARHHGFVKRLVIVTVLAAFAGSVQASTVTYDLTGAGPFSGTVTLGSLSASPYLVTAADITLNDSAVGNPVFNDVQITAYGSSYPGSNYAEALILDPAGDYLEFFYLTNYSNDFVNLGDVDLSVCDDASLGCGGAESLAEIGNQAFLFFGGSLNPETSGSPPPPATTPEPSSLLLLGTGIFGVAAFPRRGVRRAC